MVTERLKAENESSEGQSAGGVRDEDDLSYRKVGRPRNISREIWTGISIIVSSKPYQYETSACRGCAYMTPRCSHHSTQNTRRKISTTLSATCSKWRGPVAHSTSPHVPDRKSTREHSNREMRAWAYTDHDDSLVIHHDSICSLAHVSDDLSIRKTTPNSSFKHPIRIQATGQVDHSRSTSSIFRHGPRWRVLSIGLPVWIRVRREGIVKDFGRAGRGIIGFTDVLFFTHLLVLRRIRHLWIDNLPRRSLRGRGTRITVAWISV